MLLLKSYHVVGHLLPRLTILGTTPRALLPQFLHLLHPLTDFLFAMVLYLKEVFLTIYDIKAMKVCSNDEIAPDFLSTVLLC